MILEIINKGGSVASVSTSEDDDVFHGCELNKNAQMATSERS